MSIWFDGTRLVPLGTIGADARTTYQCAYAERIYTIQPWRETRWAVNGGGGIREDDLYDTLDDAIADIDAYASHHTDELQLRSNP
jgi:hypothetical protein